MLRVRQRYDGFEMSLSTSLPHRSNARHRWLSLAKMFVARIIASCRSRVEIILTFIATVFYQNHKATRTKNDSRDATIVFLVASLSYPKYKSTFTFDFFLSFCWFDISFLMGQSDTIYFELTAEKSCSFGMTGFFVIVIFLIFFWGQRTG